jgi:hypothetical protein
MIWIVSCFKSLSIPVQPLASLYDPFEYTNSQTMMLNFPFWGIRIRIHDSESGFGADIDPFRMILPGATCFT